MSDVFDLGARRNALKVIVEAADIAAEAPLKRRLRSTLARAGLYQIDRGQTQGLYQDYRRLFGTWSLDRPAVVYPEGSGSVG